MHISFAKRTIQTSPIFLLCLGWVLVYTCFSEFRYLNSEDIHQQMIILRLLPMPRMTESGQLLESNADEMITHIFDQLQKNNKKKKMNAIC